MEYYGKILCISKEDLIRDDRPAVGGYQIDNTKAPIMTNECYKSLVKRGKIRVVRKGIGRGVTALVAVESLPEKYRKMVEQKYGDMKSEILRNWFAAHWSIDENARVFFAGYRLASGKELELEQQQEYVLNASAIRAVLRLMDDVKMKRAVMQGNRVCWEEMAGAINFYQAEFGHTLPTSVNRFKKKVNEFKEKSYASLISKKFGNQNTRLVNIKIEKLLVSIAARPNRPWNTSVHEMYNQFVRGELEMYDPETGEIYSPEDYTDKKGNPIELSPSTVQYYLSLPKNQALIDKQHMSWTTFMHEQRPHVHRENPGFAFSLISFDDRDLPRKLKDTKQRPKAYYAYDVASQCVVGYAYSRKKDIDLVVDMFRSMFRLIDRNGWGTPAQVEVENHLMSQWKDGFLKAGEVFPFVHFCAPQNSQEKHAEQFNGAKKRSLEHEHQLGIGRFYAKNKKYRTEAKKVFDELNDTYEDKQYYTWDELIAEDQEIIRLFNESLHPNQKKYPGMSRWQVLCETMNPNLEPYDKSFVAKYIGEHVETSIRRNSYCRVNYTDYWLSSPEVIERLAPNNYKVDAYYIPEEDGSIKDLFIYQNGKLIDKLVDMGKFNTAAAEQTEEDRRIMTEQLKFGKAFDRMMERNAAKPVGILKKETARKIKEVQPKEVQIPQNNDDMDFLNYDPKNYVKRAIASI
nr:hypothetical protein [Parabacteroides goldsteinii]